MGTIFCIGEALVDFIPDQKACPLKSVKSFCKKAGGAPANVAADAAKLGAKSAYIGKLGKDAFGTFLTETLARYGVDMSRVVYTDEAPTGLAFVSLDADGDRDFIFYRNPSADMLLRPDELCAGWFQRGDILHFGSVDLVDDPVRAAHRQAIAFMKAQGGTISFDPNVRLSLFKDPKICKKLILEFLPCADILKISEDEMEFIFDTADAGACFQKVKELGIRLFVVTRGKDGADLYAESFSAKSTAPEVDGADTTGAGDAFVAAMLTFLEEHGGIDGILHQDAAEELLRFSCAAGSLTATKEGAIESAPTRLELDAFLQK
jgi:fructokinase